MEKPSLTYDISPRLLSQTSKDRQLHDRYYDRMLRRSIPVLHDTDDDENQKSVWRGDHSFSPDAATYSLINFIEPEVAAKHPEWSKEEVHSAALSRFETRLRQDLSFENKESVHEEPAVTWRPIQTGECTWELATEYGDTMVTLTELWEHTKEYAAFVGNPLAYNQEEHAMQLRMQDEFIHGGASGFVSVLSHPDSVRYVQMWHKTEDGEVTSTQIDLYKTTGRDFSHKEGVRLIEHLASYHGENVGKAADNLTYAHFFVHEEKPIAEGDIRTIAIAQVMEVREYTPLAVDEYLPYVCTHVAQKAASDTAESFVLLGRYFRDQIDYKIQMIKDREVVNAPKNRENHTGSRSSEFRRRKPGIPRMPALSETRRDRFFKHSLAVNVPSASGSSETVKSWVADWWITRTIMHHVTDIPVGAVAAMYWFTTALQKNGSESVRDSSRATAPVSERHMILRKKSEKKKKWFVVDIFRFSSLPRKEKRPYRMKRRITAAGHNAGIPLRQQLLRYKEAKTLSSQEQVIRAFLAYLRQWAVYVPTKDCCVSLQNAGIGERKDAFSLRPDGAKELQPEYAVQRYIFAVVVWWVLHTVSQVKTGQHEVPQRQADSPAFSDVRNVSELIRSPWVLFAIIWQLAAIRESGNAVQQSAGQIQAAKQKRKKPNATPVNTNTFPASGIIFTFASW